MSESENHDFVCQVISLFDLILYAPVNSFSVMSGWVFLVWAWVLRGGWHVLLKDTIKESGEAQTCKPGDLKPKISILSTAQPFNGPINYAY